MQVVANILLTFSLYALIGIGFYLIYRTHKFLNLGHGSMITVGAYMVFLFSHHILKDSIFGISLSIIIGAVITGLLGLVLDIILYRKLRDEKRSPLTIMVASLGVSIILESIITLLFTSQFHTVDTSGHFAVLLHFFG